MIRSAMTRGLCAMSLLLGATLMSACGGGGGEAGGQGDQPPTGALTISGPAIEPSAILPGQQTTVTITTGVSGSKVDLFRVRGTTIALLGEMHDDGQNGDLGAGDHIYTLVAQLNEQSDDRITLRIKAISGGIEGVRDLSLPVVRIPTPSSAAEVNQLADDLYAHALVVKMQLTSVATDGIQSNTPVDFLPQLGSNFLRMFEEFEALTTQDFFGLFNLGKEKLSCEQKLNILKENPNDPRVAELKRLLITSGFTEAELQHTDQLDLYLNARALEFNGQLNPNGCGVRLLKSSEKILVKEIVSEPVSIIGKGVADLFDIGFWGRIGIRFGGGPVAGTIVDYMTNEKGEQNILIGKIQDGEDLIVPSGVHNVVSGFGGTTDKGVVKNIVVQAQQTTTINIAPGDNITLPPPVTSFTLYGVDDTNDRLVTLTIFPPGSPEGGPFGLVEVIPIGPIGFTSVRGLAYDARSDKLYAVDHSTPAGQLLTIDRSTGRGTAVGSMGLDRPETDPNYLGGFIQDLTSGPGNALLGLAGGARSNSRLITIDPLTGQGALVGNSVLPQLAGLTFVPQSGRLFANYFTVPAQLLELNPSTGAVLGNSTVSGIGPGVKALASDPRSQKMFGVRLNIDRSDSLVHLDPSEIFLGQGTGVQHLGFIGGEFGGPSISAIESVPGTVP